MIWFRNAIIYHFTEESVLTAETLEKAVNDHWFKACAATEMSSMGWISPESYEDETKKPFIEQEQQLLLRIKKESKIVPASVVKERFNIQLADRETTLARRLNSTEKAALKEEVLHTLLPRAFSRQQFISVWIDLKNHRIVIDTRSFTIAESILALLRKSLGVLSVHPLMSGIAVEQRMTQWVTQSTTLTHFTLGDCMELEDQLGGVISCKKQEITSDDVLALIHSGKWVRKLQLISESCATFLLHNDLTLKQIRFDEAILEAHGDYLPEEKQQQNEADFLLMSSHLSRVIDELINNLS